jgi:translation initiation factor IF-1
LVPQPGEVPAEFIAHRGGFRFLVRLEDGREVVAAVPKRVARDMFCVVAGDRVRVSGTDGPRPTVLGFVR